MLKMAVFFWVECAEKPQNSEFLIFFEKTLCFCKNERSSSAQERVEKQKKLSDLGIFVTIMTWQKKYILL